MVTKADKGNSTVISYLKDYEQKVLEFISKSGADLSDYNITARFLNLEPPSLRGLIKVHKINTPIRPVVNFKNAPSYKLAKRFTYIKIIHPTSKRLHCPKFDPTNERSEIPFVPSLKITSLDISDMYTNIPTEDVINIISNLCVTHNFDKALTKDILTITRLIITQNYFCFKGRTYVQRKV